MRKILLFFLFFIALAYSSHAQLAVAKILGKDANKSKLGFGVFGFYEFPLNDAGNKSIRLELLDFAYFPSDNSAIDPAMGYLSIKLGYKYTFSDSKTGLYLEPQAGYCRVVFTSTNQTDVSYGDGVAAALEAGYTLEVGERGNMFNFGLKYEADLGGSEHNLNSISLRVSYSFGLFKR